MSASATSLEQHIRAQIEASGPISVADYMALCLGDPQHGYYMRRQPFGRDGDFTTAPEVSQMFGEVIGAWCLETWASMGRPAGLRLVELGPGRGTLMADMLRVARLDPAFYAAASVHLVEMSPRLRETQQATLDNAPLPLHWHDTLDQVPQGPTILIANEFFDALPIRQWVLTQNHWRERVIGLSHQAHLIFGLGPQRLDVRDLPPGLSPAASGTIPQGSILETAPTANAIAATIGQRLVRDTGVALIIDYGYERTAIGNTLQAMRRHAYADLLADPGEADITAHVNFEALARAAGEAGVTTRGPISQADLLVALGLLERAGSLGSDKDAATQEQLRTDVERLVSPEQMGTLFKALAFSAGCPPPHPFVS